jgi:hypothetical protein
MLKHSVRNRDSRTHIYLFLLLVAVIATPVAGWSFALPADVALRIRLDDTLTSTDSQVGDRLAQPSSIGASTATLRSTDTSAALQRRAD